MKKLLAMAAAVAALTATTPAQAASLLGDLVNINLTANSDFGTKSNLLVGAGEEGSYFSNQFFDFNAGVNGDIFTIRSTSGFSSIDGVGGQPVTWTLTGLDFGTALTGFTVLQSLGPVTIVGLTATSVTFQYADVAIPSGIYFQGRFETAGNGVPEPATWALMISGFGLVGTALRRRRSFVAA
jgi:hypothetical protein